MTEGQQRSNRKFSAELKRDGVELVLAGGKLVCESARDLGICDSRLGVGSGKRAPLAARRRG
ncbi:hypothetical protein [Haloechinothrix alba]|uniref:hypothetical protein n=1 Tax=Haloechinothrix alba TaxID=664784 RepID=UPI00112FE18B|nr:hypothetical protein [Haloechinothrix alba]